MIMTNLHALRRVLRQNFNIFLATSGEDALAIMNENEIALIIADYDIHGMADIKLLEIARRHRYRRGGG